MSDYPITSSRVDGDKYGNLVVDRVECDHYRWQAPVPSMDTLLPFRRVPVDEVEENAQDLPLRLVRNQQNNTWNPDYDEGENKSEVSSSNATD